MSDGGFLPGHRFGKARPALPCPPLPVSLRRGRGEAGWGLPGRGCQGAGLVWGDTERGLCGALLALPEGKAGPVGGPGAASRRGVPGMGCGAAPDRRRSVCGDGGAWRGLTASYLWL